jgi:ureidoglycolate lyase
MIRPTEIDAASFAPYGDLISCLPDQNSLNLSGSLENFRPDARVHLYTTIVKAVVLPHEIKVMERHQFSSQTFFPLDVGCHLICVAPHDSVGLPDEDLLRAFIVPSGAGTTYRANVWHHPMMALDRAAGFAVLMWRNESESDEQFVDLKRARVIEAPF